MFSMWNRIRIDSLARVIIICALIAVAMNLVLVSALKAETTEKALDKKAHVIIPNQENDKPGDADDILGKTKLDIQQGFLGEDDYSETLNSSINIGTNNSEIHRDIYLMVFCFMYDIYYFYLVP